MARSRGQCPSPKRLKHFEFCGVHSQRNEYQGLFLERTSLVAQMVIHMPRRKPQFSFRAGKIPGRDRFLTPLSGFLHGSVGKESACSAGDQDSVPGLGRSPGGGHGNPLQYSCLETAQGQRSLAAVHGVTKSWTGLSD